MQSECGGDHIDAAIDAAARSLTAGEPSAALRAGVRERIGERSPVASAFPCFAASAFRRKGWLVPAAALAAVIAVVIVGRALLGPPHESNRVRTADVRLAIDRATTQSVSRTGGPDGGWTLSGPPARPTGAPDNVRSTVKSPQPLAAATLELPFEELEPLIPPITIEPLETRLIVVDTSSGVMPIEIEPLQIEPLRGD